MSPGPVTNPTSRAGERARDPQPSCDELVALVAELGEVIARLVEDNRGLVEDNRGLAQRVEELEAELGRHSQNSGKPPSSDSVTQRGEQNARRQSQRRRSGRKQGKQPGAEGQHLAAVADPDQVVTHSPAACAGCGAGLEGATLVAERSRQVFDLPDVRLGVTEHGARTLRCGCGHDTAATFPHEAMAAAGYGPNVTALAVYLLYRQHLPVARTAELLAAVVGAPVSTGWLASLGPRALLRLKPFLEALVGLLSAERVVHVDETGARIAGKRWWFHTTCTALLSLIVCHPRRGSAACDDIGVLPAFRGTAVHDGWRPTGPTSTAATPCAARTCCATWPPSPRSPGRPTGPKPWPSCSSKPSRPSPPPAPAAATGCHGASCRICAATTTPSSPKAGRPTPTHPPGDDEAAANANPSTC